MEPQGHTTTQKNRKNVLWLGWTSLFTDVSSEMIFPILPLFMKNILGAPFAAIGLAEGLAEMVSSFMKYFSGWLSDVSRKRKPLTIAGYSLSALSKLFFAIAPSWIFVLIFRSVDRVGKGLRTSPRDALIADSVGTQERGKYFGLHRAMDTTGAFFGVLVAFVLLYVLLSGDSLGPGMEGAMRNVFLFAFLPAIVGVLLLALFVKDVIGPKIPRPKLFDLKGFSKRFWIAVALLGLFSFGNISYAFFILKAEDMGMAILLIPLLYLLYNFSYAATAYPAGKISDKVGRVKLMTVGFLLLAAVLLGFAIAYENWMLWGLFFLYGISVGVTDSVGRAFISDIGKQERKGTSFGIYHAVLGIGALAGNLLFGVLWDAMGGMFPFVFASSIILLAAILFLFFFRDHVGFQQKYGLEAFKGYR